MENDDKSKIRDLFLGSAMGTFVGDAMGEPVEGWFHKAIQNHFGLVETMVRGKGRYTDDTQMMIGLLETLLERGRFDPAVCAKKFLKNYDPKRGYGRRIFGVMEKIREGIPWDEVGTDSFGNGGAMRVAPIGCFYSEDLGAVKAQAILSARITHNHPEGLAGAVAQATAVGLAMQCGQSDKPIVAEGFLDKVIAQVIDIDKGFAKALDKIRLIEKSSVLDMIAAMAARFSLSLKAIESVPVAIGAFLLTDTFRDAVVFAVNMGGDADTIGAMAGAVAGAYHGYKQIPTEWLQGLENGVKGRDYVVDCVEALV